MFKNTIKLDKALFERAALRAEKAGYSSLQEFVEHVLEKELARLEEAEGQEEVIRRLQGLGYLD